MQLQPPAPETTEQHIAAIYNWMIAINDKLEIMNEKIETQNKRQNNIEEEQDKRLDKLERWQNRVIGALMLASFTLGLIGARLIPGV